MVGEEMTGRRSVSLVLGAATLVVVATLACAAVYVTANNRNPVVTATAPATTDTVTAPPTAVPVTAPPMTEGGLDDLLLTPDQVDSAMGAKGMTVGVHSDEMFDVSDFVPDKACLPLASVVEDPVYAGSGWTAVRKQELENPQNDRYVGQAAVLFPSVRTANAFFAASTQKWPACSNRRYTFTENQPHTVYTVGSVHDTNSTLTVDATVEATGRTCERALTVANNVVIDVAACSPNTKDQGAAIAHQIAAKVRIS